MDLLFFSFFFTAVLAISREVSRNSRPEPPTPIEVTNAMLSSCVEPGTNVTFSCSANVGRPANNSGLLWYLVKDDGTIHDVTAWATEKGLDLLAGEPPCTFRKSSTLTMTFDRNNYPGKTSVRCAVNHPEVNYTLCTTPSVHFCQKAPDVCLKGVAVRNDDYGSDTSTDSDIVNTEGKSGDGESKENKTKGKDTDSGDSSQTVNVPDYTTQGTSAVTVILGFLGGMSAVIFFGMVTFYFCGHKSTAVSRSRVPSVGRASTPSGVMAPGSHAVPPASTSLGSGYSSAETSQSKSQYSSGPLSNVDDDPSSAYSARSSGYN